MDAASSAHREVSGSVTDGDVSDKAHAGLGIFSRPALALALSAAAIAYLILLSESMGQRWKAMDYGQWYVSALALRHGTNPYTNDLAPLANRFGIVSEQRANYPPTFSLLFEPLTRFTPQSAYRFWKGLEFLSLALSLWVLVWKATSLDLWARLAVASLVVFFFPVSENIYCSEVSLLLLVLLLLMQRATQRGHDFVAGAALAVASLLKLYPIIALGYLALWKRWKTIGWTILITAIGLIFTVAVIDIRVSLSFFTRLGYLQDQAGPLSAAGMILHSFKFTIGLPSTTKMRIAYRILALAAQMVVLALAVKGTLKAQPDAAGEEHTFGLWLVAMVLVSPTAWAHYMVLFLPTLIQLASAVSQRTATPEALLCGIATYFIANVLGLLYVGSLRSKFFENALGLSSKSNLLYGLLSPCGILTMAIAYSLSTQVGAPH
jgi:hypothetical protein